MTTQELAQEIQAHRAYLNKRRVHRNDNPHVTKIASFERGLYILYRYTNNKSGYSEPLRSTTGKTNIRLEKV